MFGGVSKTHNVSYQLKSKLLAVFVIYEQLFLAPYQNLFVILLSIFLKGFKTISRQVARRLIGFLIKTKCRK